MIPYASRTHTARNLAALRSAHWRILLSPERGYDPPDGFRFAIDNGAWTCFKKQIPFDGEAFARLLERHGAAADFVVMPDIVAGGPRSLELSLAWLDRLRHFRLILLPVQDEMDEKDVGAVLQRTPNMGIFLGGSTEYKLKHMYAWGMVAHAFRRYYHIGRVNTMRRIRLCAEAGADSFDGTSATMYAVTLPKLDTARKQPSLYTPARTRTA